MAASTFPTTSVARREVPRPWRLLPAPRARPTAGHADDALSVHPAGEIMRRGPGRLVGAAQEPQCPAACSLRRSPGSG